MADEYNESGNPKTPEDTQENMEQGEISQDSSNVAAAIPPTSTGTPKAASASSGEAAASDPSAECPPDQPVLEPVPESGPSDKTKTEVKRPGFLKTVKKACKNVLTKISPRKHDKAPFVPEGAPGVASGAPSTAAAAGGVMSRPPKGRRGTLVIDSPTSEARTVITEVSASSDDGDSPEDAARKASVVSSDTAAHISMLANLDEPSLVQETGEEAKSADENKECGGDSDVPMESEE